MLSPLVLSSGVRSRSPDVSWGKPVYRSLAPQNEPLEDGQEERLSADIMVVMSWMQDTCDLPPALSEGRKI